MAAGSRRRIYVVLVLIGWFGNDEIAMRGRRCEDAVVGQLVAARRWGWFLQRIGAGWRWHVGGIDCDGGTPAPGRWTHLVATFDGETARLFQDGRLVAERAGRGKRARWPGPLHIGHYSGGAAPRYQVRGRIAGVRIYDRALPRAEAAALGADSSRNR